MSGALKILKSQIENILFICGRGKLSISCLTYIKVQNENEKKYLAG
jgi:hypothetical protein